MLFIGILFPALCMWQVHRKGDHFPSFSPLVCSSVYTLRLWKGSWESAGNADRHCMYTLTYWWECNIHIGRTLYRCKVQKGSIRRICRTSVQQVPLLLFKKYPHLRFTTGVNQCPGPSMYAPDGLLCKHMHLVTDWPSGKGKRWQQQHLHFKKCQQWQLPLFLISYI